VEVVRCCRHFEAKSVTWYFEMARTALLKRYCRAKNFYFYNLYVTHPRFSQNS